MSLQNGAYGFGATWAHVGLSAPVVVNAPKYAQGGFIQKQSAGGTLWLGSGISLIPGVSGMAYLNTDTVPFTYEGPARFFLYGTGTTMIVGLGFNFSAGLSSPIAG